MPAASVQVVSTNKRARAAGEGDRRSDSQFILNALRRRWKLAVPAGVILAAASAAVVYLLFEPQFEATALLEVEERIPYVAFESKGEGRSRAYFQTQVELMRSPWVLRPAVEELAKGDKLPRELKRQPDPVTWLGKQIKVMPAADSNLLRVVYTSPSGEDAARVVNTIQSKYFMLRNESEAKQNDRLIRILGEEVKIQSDRVSALRDKVRKLAKEMLGRDTVLGRPESEPAASRQPSDMQAHLITAEVDVTVLDARIKAGEAELESAQQRAAAEAPKQEIVLSKQEIAMRDLLVEKILADNPEIKRLEAVIAAKQAQYDQYLTAYVKGKDDPSCQRLQMEMQRDAHALAELRDKTRSRCRHEADLSVVMRRTESDVAFVGRQREELAKLRSERGAHEILRKRLQEKYNEEQEKLRQFGGDTAELVFARDELTRAEGIFQLIARRQLELQTEQGAPARVILRHPATVPEAPLEIFPWKRILIALFAGLAAPFGLAVLWERMVRRISDTQDLERQSRLTVLGEIARLPAGRRVGRSTAAGEVVADFRVFEESVDHLRTILALSEGFRDTRILAVTSAANHEGKTSVASQLAMSLARVSGEQVLLIDGDMRSPDLHKLFESPLEPGLADVLAGQCPLEGAIATGWSEHVHLLPAGKLKSSPHKLLGNGAWASLLKRIPARYRHVIIDTPPVLAASEALVMTAAADASLLCVMRDVSRMDQVCKAAERLQMGGDRLVGTVLNGVPIKLYAYRYGNYGTGRG
jgi:capsular exopolysaccharide synthesis family protein